MQKIQMSIIIMVTFGLNIGIEFKKCMNDCQFCCSKSIQESHMSNITFRNEYVIDMPRSLYKPH
jgi:hypothetical protein